MSKKWLNATFLSFTQFYGFCLSHSLPGGKIRKVRKPLGFHPVLTHTPQGAFSCPCGAIHLVSSEAGLNVRTAALYQPEVRSDAHPPGGLLLPLRGNSPCVVRAGLNIRGCGPLSTPGFFD